MAIWISEILQSWRATLRRPGFLLLASGVLALGVSTSTAVFTLIEHVLWRPLPYPAAEQLMVLGMVQGDAYRGSSPRQYQHMQSLRGVASMGLIMGGTIAVNATGQGEPEQIMALRVDHDALPTLGVRLRLGRNFSMDEDRPGGPRAVILAERYWQRRYGGAMNVIGRSMQVEGVPRTIVGVLPTSFDQFGDDDIMLPEQLQPNSMEDDRNYYVVARLADGIAPAAISAQLLAAIHAMYAAMPGSTSNDWQRASFGAVPLQIALHQEDRPVMLLFLASALCVLLIAVVNLTNLMLLRALSHNHDAAVRAALGASPWRLALPALAEGGLIGVGGALVGMGLAMIGLALFSHFMPIDWTHGEAMHPEWEAWVLALAVGVLGALLAAILAVWRSRAAVSTGELREGGRSMSRQSGRLGRALVVAQMSLATCLLCGAGLFLHALYDAAHASLGFSSDHVLTFDLAPVLGRNPDAASTRALAQRVVQRLSAVPGVEQAAVTNGLPAGDQAQQFNMGGVHAPNQPYFDTPLQMRGVSTDYFSLFRIALKQGRAFAATDIAGSEPVAIVNEALARHEYGGHALGKFVVVNDYSGYPGGKLLAQDPDKQPVVARIIGVVADTRQSGPLDDGHREFLYMPLAQVPSYILNNFRYFNPFRFAVRVKGDPNTYRGSVHAAVAEVAPGQPIATLRTMDDVVHATTDYPRMNLMLVGLFALMALGLAAVGMYAVMAVAVTARQREFGVRMALGASPVRLASWILRGGMLQILAGLLLGLGLALLLSHLARAVLEQLGRTVFDLPAMLGTSLALALVGLIACLLPALRAGRVQPMSVLRGD
ncbi:ADOP family duplicated permease [Dyella flagellata]|uniref:Permease n=1 Tax=Dyella flagellata TaxID=1867833 RepID=A0ABQ5XGR7_9GAMM|nr:ADOP family duplicated permease [Dyella flagellata]GLQ90896.1 hypothetical protein GCM10007898_44720 [Dyella flagellata]